MQCPNLKAIQSMGAGVDAMIHEHKQGRHSTFWLFPTSLAVPQPEGNSVDGRGRGLNCSMLLTNSSVPPTHASMQCPNLKAIQSMGAGVDSMIHE